MDGDHVHWFYRRTHSVSCSLSNAIFEKSWNWHDNKPGRNHVTEKGKATKLLSTENPFLNPSIRTLKLNLRHGVQLQKSREVCIQKEKGCDKTTVHTKRERVWRDHWRSCESKEATITGKSPIGNVRSGFMRLSASKRKQIGMSRSRIVL